MRPFADPNDRYSYEDWMNEMGADEGLPELPPMGHPLQKLGARLGELLDEDHWAECERLLLEGWAHDEIDRETGRHWRENSDLEVWFPMTAEELERLRAENTTLQQGYDAARMEIESLRDEVKEYRHGAGVQKALIETLLADKPAGEYPPLPEHAALIMRGKPLHMNWIRHVDTPVFTADQMRAYVDADRAMRAQAAPASQDAATGLKDGDIAALVNRLRDIAIEYSDTQQLRERIASEIRPRAAGLVVGGINKIDSQRILELTAQLAGARRDAEVNKQINRACAELPDDYRIVIEIERDAGWMCLLRGGEEMDFDDPCEGVASSISAAIDAAKGERE